MTVLPVAIDATLEAELYTCDSCGRARRPLFLARRGAQFIGLACDACLSLGKFPPKRLPV